MIIDTHAHLYYPEIINQLEDILARAKDNEVEKIIVPAIDLETSKEVLALSEKYGMIYGALGIHPSEVNKFELDILDEIEKLLNHEKIVAIGEIGLDYYWDTSNIEKQKSFFKLQIELAKAKNLPVVIHTRNSIDDAIEIIMNKYDKTLKGQFHCFSGNITQLEKILSIENFYVSYCGNITYKNFSETDVVKKTPVEKILSETDSPFLTPTPYRGKKNEPSYITHTLKKISEFKEMDYSRLIKIIQNNVERIFFKRFI